MATFQACASFSTGSLVSRYQGEPPVRRTTTSHSGRSGWSGWRTGKASTLALIHLRRRASHSPRLPQAFFPCAIAPFGFELALKEQAVLVTPAQHEASGKVIQS